MKYLLLLITFITLLSCRYKKNHKPGFDTPEGAILMLQNAYKKKDLEAALKCKDFEIEAAFLLKKFKKAEKSDAMFKKATNSLRHFYIKEIEESGFPEVPDLPCEFTKREFKSRGHIIVTEVCKYPNGATYTQKIPTVKTKDGWRVLTPLD